GLALDEIKPMMTEDAKTVEPQELFFVLWEQAIPQYNQSYCQLLPVIERRLGRYPGLHLSANYLKGISLNDCVENAYQAARMP
ncbi:MAG TPA: hypothetical protein PKV41_03140, partial [Candidatus Omnitrophota bacterium]|nr:hypothetical protein [Candidatus Omnitrophota bacterium]